MFREPLPLIAKKDVAWSVSAPDLRISGHGATPEEVLDDLASAIVMAVGSIRNNVVSAGVPEKALFSRYIDLDRPCPDPDVKVCSDE